MIFPAGHGVQILSATLVHADVSMVPSEQLVQISLETPVAQ